MWDVKRPRRERKRDALLSRRVVVRMVIRRTWRSGKRGTRRERMPRNRVTVWVGMRLENATRKEVCRAIVPFMDVRLGRC